MDVPRPDCQTPVLFLIHRRPRHASRVLEGIRQARPARLLVAGDGPENDAACQETRRIVLEGIDWPCDVVTRFSETRLGCRRAVASALDWAFGHHEALIVLEDDCVPAPGFFGFCQSMLERYHDSEEIMQICGSNLTAMIGTPLGLVLLAGLENQGPKVNLAEQGTADAILCMLCLGGGIQRHSSRPQARPRC